LTIAACTSRCQFARNFSSSSSTAPLVAPSSPPCVHTRTHHTHTHTHTYVGLCESCAMHRSRLQPQVLIAIVTQPTHEAELLRNDIHDRHVGQVAECQTGLHSTQVHLTAFVTLCFDCSIRFACKRRVWPHRLECFAAWPSPSVNLIRAVQTNPRTYSSGGAHTHWLRTSQLTQDYQTHALHPPTHTLAHAYHMSGCKRWSTCAHTCKPRASTSTHLLVCCSR
jgi:hypothetical protein